jgi:cell division protein FtsX
VRPTIIVEQPWLNSFLKDLRYSFRSLRRDAGFATFAILIVGLGIGASSTLFSVVNALLLRPLPFGDPQRLVWVTNYDVAGLSGQTTQVGHMVDLREQNRSFADLAGYFAFYGVGDNILGGQGTPERLSSVPVSCNFFPVLGVEPELGRQFTAEECKWHGPKAVLLSHGFWERRFASDRSIVGRPLTIDNEPVTVAGVLPASFDFSSIFAPGSHVDFFAPFPLTAETDRWGNTMAMVGRLKPGVSIGSAGAEIKILAGRITQAHPERNGFEGHVVPLADHVSGRMRLALFVLAGAVGVVMLIVCANLSNLLLARTAARQKEIAIRTALGAGQWRLIRQMLTEGVALSCCGAALGVVLALGGTRALAHLDAINIPLLQNVRTDGAALAFTLLMAVAKTARLGTRLAGGFGDRVCLRAAGGRGPVDPQFCEGARRGPGLPSRAGGFAARGSRTEFPLAGGGQRLFRRRVTARPVGSGSGERGAHGRASAGPQSQLGSGGEGADLPEGQESGRLRARGEPWLHFHHGDPHPVWPRPYGAGRGVGRSGDPHQRDHGAHLVSRRRCPGEIMLTDKERRIVGVVGDVRHLALEQGAGMEFYLPIRQCGDWSGVDLVLRTTLPPSQFASAIRAALKPVAPNLPGNDFRLVQQLVDKAVSPRRFVVLLLGGFALFALILASLGIYGVISYSVSQRTQEIGIRMALGASAGSLQARIILQTLGLAAAGMTLGAAASWIMARALSGMLFETTASDPVTFVGMLLVLAAVSAVAGYLPARRASRIDPSVALRAN